MEYNFGNSKNQKQRLNCLINYLLSNQGASLRNILDNYDKELGSNFKEKKVINRQFSYDKEFLKKEGVLIEYNSNIRGYELIELPEKSKRMLIPEEYAEELPILFSLLNQEQHLLSVDWLKNELNEKYNIKEEAWENETYFSKSFTERNNDVELELCLKIIRLMKSETAIKFLYCKVNTNEILTYTVAPLQIRLSNDMYFLAACKYVDNKLDDNISIFRIDMIQNLKVQEAMIQQTNGLTQRLTYNYKWLADASGLNDYFKYCIGVFNPNSGGLKSEPKHIKLKFTKWACSQVMKKKIHHTQTIPNGLQTEIIEDKEQIYCIVHIKVYETVELDNLLGRYRDDVKVIKE